MAELRRLCFPKTLYPNSGRKRPRPRHLLICTEMIQEEVERVSGLRKAGVRSSPLQQLLELGSGPLTLLLVIPSWHSRELGL